MRTFNSDSVPLSIVIINVKGKQYLAALLNSILQSSYTNFEVIVVDDQNLSIDDQRVKVVKIAEDKGVAYCRNLGVKNSTGKFILFLDNDTVLEKDTLEKFIDYMLSKDKNDTIVQLKLLKPDRKIDAAGGLLDDLGYPIELMKGKDEDCLKNDLEVIYAKGAAMGLSRELAYEIGLFDEKYFYGYEETDLCYRAKKMGKKVLALSIGNVIHKEHGSFSGTDTKREYRLTFFLESRRLYFVFKNFDSITLIKIAPRLAFYFVGSIAKDILNGRFHFAKAKIKAIGWFVLQLGHISKIRIKQRGTFRINEEDLVRTGLLKRYKLK
ncbi:MAG: glycosyltransferase [Sulfuracidifex metallicus]|nr:glycosyltransferase [Sulfuracidifex metallicus]MCY0850997.1 glycosyltransferase [Sulfuracidifex metallicus]